jgi:hypothetical protein
LSQFFFEGGSKDRLVESKYRGNTVNQHLSRLPSHLRNRRLAEHKLQLWPVHQEVGCFVPLAEIPAETMPTAAVDHSQKGSLPPQCGSPLDHDPVCLIVQFSSKCGHYWFPVWWDFPEQSLEVITVFDLDKVDAQGATDESEKLLQVRWLTMNRNPLLNPV